MGIKHLGFLLVGFCLSACSGVGPGLLYTNIILPFSTDFNETRLGSKQVVLDEYRLREPLSGLGLALEWSNDRLRSEAEKAGITHITYVDEQRLSILLGIYSKRSLIVYGD